MMGQNIRKSASDLRELLLDAALRILAEENTPLGLRKVAERAGKSRTAPYLVFGQKQDGGGLIGLKLAVATRGTELLRSAILNEIASTTDPREVFELGTRAFLTFANENPRLFRLMFGPEVAEVSAPSVEDSTDQRNPLELITDQPELEGLIEARLSLESVLKDLIERCQEAGYLPDGDLVHTLLVVARAWISLHGTASLMLDPVYRSFVPLSLSDFVDLATGAILGPTTTDDGLRNAAICLLAAQKLRGEADRQEETTAMDEPPISASSPVKYEDHIQDDFFAFSEDAIEQGPDKHHEILPFGAGREQPAEKLSEPPRRHTPMGDHWESNSSEVPETVEFSAVLRRASLTRDVLKGSSVLWIDDHTESISPEKQTLEHLGVNVITAETTREGLEKLRNETIDLILSDIDRAGDPDEGVLSIPRIREIAPKTPIIFYIGQIETEKGIPQGAAGITNQPEELLHLVLDQLERARV